MAVRVLSRTGVLVLFATLLAGLLMKGVVAGAEPPPAPERTFRARCLHESHGHAIWLESAYVSVGAALMQAHTHNKENPGHDAFLLRLRGGRR